MKITAINIYDVNLPVMGMELHMSNSSVDALESTLVEVVTDKEVTGYGEVCPIGPLYAPQSVKGARTALAEICPALIGCNPLQIDTIYRTMDGAINGLRYAKAAVDIAMWDIAGKAYNVRVCDLLGGAVREKIPSYHSTFVLPPDETARMVKEKQAEGFFRVQVKVGGRPFEQDLETIAKVGEIIRTDMRWAVDANRSWTTVDMMNASRLHEKSAFVLEQPCNSYDEIACARSLVRHPIYLDEVTENLGVILRAAVEGVAQGFALKVTRLGGISAVRTVRDVCQARRLPFSCDDSWGGDIIAAACTHLAATMDPALCEGAWVAAPYINGNYDEENGIRIKNGWIDVPKGAGLGITPDLKRWGKLITSYS